MIIFFRIFGLTISLVSVVLVQSSLTQSLIIQPEALLGKDALDHENEPNLNFGNTIEFISLDWTFSGNEALGFSLLKFDLSSKPENSQTIEVNLSLYYNHTSSSAGQAGDNACNLKKVISLWDENEVTWNTKPATSNKNLLPTSTESDQGYLDIDMTEFVSWWHADPSSNNGIIIEIINQSLYDSMKFCSSDYDELALRPRLEVVLDRLNSTSSSVQNKIDFTLRPIPTNNLYLYSLNHLGIVFSGLTLKTFWVK